MSTGVPTVSVLMSVHNAGAYLTPAVESILAQSFDEFEFLILDDGSTDRSGALLQEFAARDPRIRLISRENRGLTKSLNELLAAARGKYIARMDADDIALPDRFARQVAFLHRHRDVLCVGGAFEIIDQAGRYLTTIWPPCSDEEIQSQMLRGHCAISHPTAMARRAALVEIGGYQRDLVEDLDLWLRLGERGRLANLSEVVLRYRLHGKSISEQAGLRQREAGRAACEAAWQRRGIEDGVYEAGQLWRPSSDRASRHAFMLQYGWWAWNSRARQTATVYGLKAVTTKPFDADGWKLLLVSLLKPTGRAQRPTA
jgi:hypothetical protein